MKRLLLNCLIISASLLACSSKTHAQVAAYDFTAPGTTAISNVELGWAFTPKNRINVTTLGMYAHLNSTWGGRSDFFEVRLWDDARGLQLGSGFVDGSDSLEGFFRFRELRTPITLSAGQTYVISTHMKLQRMAKGSSISGFSTASDITFAENRFRNTPGLFPTATLASDDPGYFGPNFKFNILAGDFTWTNPSGGDFSDGANWDLSAPPVSTDNAIFDLIGGGTYTIRFTESATNSFFEVRGDSTVIFDLNGNNYTTSGKTTIEHNFLGAATVLNVQGGGILTTGETEIADGSGTQGQLIISGPNTQWDAAGVVHIGNFGVGSLTVEDGAAATSSGVTYVGRDIGSDGSSVQVKGANSTWEVSNTLEIGASGNASMIIEDGGVVTSDSGKIAVGSISDVTVKNPMSAWNINGTFDIGLFGHASLLIENGGTVTSTGRSDIATLSFSESNVTVRGPDARWNANGELKIGNAGNGSLLIEGGATAIASSTTYIGFEPGSQGNVMVSGLGSQWDVGDNLSIGNNGIGTLVVEEGASVVLGFGGARIGLSSASEGSSAVIKGPGSVLDSMGRLTVGANADVFMMIEDGGVVTSRPSIIGDSASSKSSVTVKDPFSAWNTSRLKVGRIGDGSLRIENGGSVTSTGPSTIADNVLSDSDVTVTDAGSSWIIGTDLFVGVDGTARLDIQNEGLVSVTGTTSIGPAGTINLDNARFEFGTMAYEDFARINTSGGSMAGRVLISGFNDVSTLSPNANVDISEVVLANSGVLYGNANLQFTLVNQSSGELRVAAGEWIRFGGVASTNSGEISNTGGIVEFNGLTNNPGAIVLGRGIFRLGDNSVNQGVFAFSGGFADIHGRLTNDGGTIAIAGGSTTTFYDDLIDAGGVIDVAAGSRVVFFGSYNGGTTGPGPADTSGDLRPGNSPAAVSFGGALNIAASATIYIEIGGLTAGDEYDQINVLGEASLAGTLDVTLIEDFDPQPGDTFSIITYDSHQGEFNTVNLPELNSGFAFDLNYGVNALTLRTLGLIGNINLDGTVNRADIASLVQQIGSAEGTWTTGDFNADGMTGLVDLSLLQENLGNSLSPSPASQTTVPEPSAIILLAYGTLGMTGGYRRRRPAD